LFLLFLFFFLLISRPPTSLLFPYTTLFRSTFRYGYLVTTSPQSLVPPSAASSQKGYLTDFGCYRLSWCDGRCVQGPGTYSPRHSDPRLLAIPASCRRIAAYNPN